MEKSVKNNLGGDIANAFQGLKADLSKMLELLQQGKEDNDTNERVEKKLTNGSLRHEGMLDYVPNKKNAN